MVSSVQETTRTTAVSETVLPSSTTLHATTLPPTTELAALTVRTGAGVLADDDFADYRGLRVGVVVNHASVVEDRHLIDIVAGSTHVELGAIFAPEHGVRGVADAGAIIDDTIDAATGVTVFSLYGSTRQPTAAMLADLDVVFFDLQDVGTRHYTYISTMGLAMQAAAAADVAFVVLDRPNPLGGQRLGGPVRDPELSSFIGQYPIPSVYGLTAGELARAIVGERWLPGLDTLDLQVVEMLHWDREMMWPATGLDWIAPSPGLPTFASALVYPGTVLIEATDVSYGSGTLEPFTQVAAPWVDAQDLAVELESRGLPGVVFEATSFTPLSIPNMAPTPRLQDQELFGVKIRVTDAVAYEPFRTGLVLLEALEQAAALAGRGSIIDRSRVFDLLTGSSLVRTELGRGVPAEEIIATLDADLAEFDRLRQPYLLY